MLVTADAIQVGEMRVNVYGEGPPLVLCHGFTTTSEFWREQVGEFAKRHRVICVNLPGHGKSASPVDRSYTIDAFVGDLERLFAELRIGPAVLVGLSMGGTIAQHFALRNQHLVRALVLVGATPNGLGPDVNAENVIRSIAALGVKEASRNVIERSFGSAAARDLIEFAKDEVVQTPEFVARAAIASLNESDTRSELGRISMPTLVVCGDEDVITPPKESRALAAGIPNAELLVIRRAGHFPMLEQPQTFNEGLRRFIARAAS